MHKKEHILIVGAGLCGSLLALCLGKRGYPVTLVEKRPDLRLEELDAGRSINLALSDRGLRGLRKAGVEEKALELCIPMHGRMIHPANGEPFLSRYSGRPHEHINSVSRPGLNMLLLDAIDTLSNVKTIFDHACKEVNLESASAVFINQKNGQEVHMKGDLLFGTDGAGSMVRKAMFKQRDFLFSFSQNWLTHGYKEITIPAAKEGGYRTHKNALHIWPRGEDMLIALPNLDGSFTVTLFLPFKNSEFCFESLTTPQKVRTYFEKEYPDAVSLMPDLEKEFFENPTAPLGTVKCEPWSSYDKTLIMGDAAHAIVPFYGQGMNASFEDVVVLDEVIDELEGDWPAIFATYQARRKKDTDAIADLALDNFHEMKEHTASQLFQQKRKLELQLETEFPDRYNSKYSLVTFNEQVSYSEAMQKGRAQDKAVLNLLSDGALPENMELELKLEKVLKTTQDILHDDRVVKNL